MSMLPRKSRRARRLPRSPTRTLFTRLTALAGTGGLALVLAAVPWATASAAAAAAPPRPGSTPSVTGPNLSIEGGGADTYAPNLFYTGTDGQVWRVQLTMMANRNLETLGGQLIGGPSAVMTQAPGVSTAATAVFGRGTDNQLWWRSEIGSSLSRWASLGGVLTSKPYAMIDPGSREIAVFVRGADGAVWYRTGLVSAAGAVRWTPSWFTTGGRLLPGTAPAAVPTGQGGFTVAAVGTDRAVWVKTSVGVLTHLWGSAGGQTTADPALALSATSAVVVFVRGTDNAGWYQQIAGQTSGVTAGWHSVGGRLTSGLTATDANNVYVSHNTSVFGLGLDNQIWECDGVLPAFHGWGLVILSP